MFIAKAEQAAVQAADRSVTAIGASSEVLSFNLGQEQYGIEILKVQEIRGYTEPTRIASAPQYIKGVMNLRGIIVPILDLRVKFGLPDAFDASTVTIVLNVAQKVVGIVVDSVSDVRTLPKESIKPAPAFSGQLDSDFILGLASLEGGDSGRLLIVVDIERLVRAADIGLGADSLH